VRYDRDTPTTRRRPAAPSALTGALRVILAMRGDTPMSSKPEAITVAMLVCLAGPAACADARRQRCEFGSLLQFS